MRALRVVVEDLAVPDRRPTEQVFSRSPVRIGRSHLNDLHLGLEYVSQYHSVIAFDEQGIGYVDLGSTNGSAVAGTPAKPFTTVPIEDGSTITIGKLCLTLARSDARPARPPAQPDSTDVNPAVGTVVDAGVLKSLRAAEAAIETVRPAYDQYRKAWQQLRTELRAALGQASPHVRALAVDSLLQSCPAITEEPELGAMLAELGVPGHAPNSGRILELAQLLGSSADQMRADRDGRQLLQGVAEILEAFATSFVELRQGVDQFGSEVAVKAFSRTTGLHAAKSAREVLSYLVSPREGDRNRVDELKGAFADIMIHQVALLTGITEGVRSLLHQLSPASVAEDLEKVPERVGWLPVRRGIWPWSVTALWRRFMRMHAETVEEDRGVSSVLFGREFARSYGAAKERHRTGSGKTVAPSSRRATSARARG